MDATLKAKWVEALRSGDYKQITGLMHNGVGYCCLGVLCQVAGRPADGSNRAYDFAVRLVGSDEAARRLVDLNDKERRDFTAIADFVEAKL